MPFNHSNLNYLVSNGVKEDKDDLNTSTSREVSKTYRSNVFTDDGGSSPLGKKVFDHGKNSSNISNLFVPKDAEKVAVVPVKKIDISERKKSVNKSQPVPRVYKNESSIVDAMRDDEPIPWAAGKTKKRSHLISDNMSPVFKHISDNQLQE